MNGARAWCRKCFKPMRSHLQRSGARGPCGQCLKAQRLSSSKPFRKAQHIDGFTDDPPDVIEAKFQAALKHARRTMRVDLTWGSSLTRFAR